MGKHTAYWQEYQKAQVRGSLRIFAAIAIWILLVILIVLSEDLLRGFLPVLIGIAFLALIVSIVVLSKDVYKVSCPECGRVYKRSRWHGQCPGCGLKLLQSDP